MKRPLTALAIKKAKKKAGKWTLIDAGNSGLRVWIFPSGAKSYVFRYRRSSGQDVTITLGKAAGPGAITLSQARELAGDARRQRTQGKDPADVRRTERATEAARVDAVEREARRKDDAVSLVLARYFTDKVNAMRSAPELKRLLSKELAVWNKRRIDDVSRADAIKLIDAIKDRGHPVLANRTRTAARTFFSWCIDKALIEQNPFERTKPVADEQPRDRVLSDAELRLILLAIDRQEWPWKPFYRAVLLLGQRRDEVAGMKWNEVDLENAIWTLPAGRTKNGVEHIVPLSRQVVAILASIERVQIPKDGKLVDSPFVFTTTGTTPISGYSHAKVRLDKTVREIAVEESTEQVAPWRLHDARRTCASGMARLGIGVAVCEKVLNHVSGTFAGIVSVYQRHDFLAEKRHALTVWADHVESLTNPKPVNESNVVQLKAV